MYAIRSYYGTVTDNGDGTFAFDPGADFQDLAVGETRQVSFTYRVDDGHGGSDTATGYITVSGTNDAPVALDDSFSRITSYNVCYTKLLRSCCRTRCR